VKVIKGSSVSLQRSQGEIFTGAVDNFTYVDNTIGEHLRLTLVHFNPGGRTKWHSHAYEQGLIITEGRGIVATEEHENVVEPGDVVVVAAGEKHWHGATEASAMTHISINTPGETTVLEAVESIRTAG
jgi:quercetin dioxygenase-like cupin family protein